MKPISLFILLISFTSCIYRGSTSEIPYNYEPAYEAVIIDRVSLDSSIELLDSQTIIESSKIYIIGDYIFINDSRKGFHIFDNTDASNPIKKKFLKFPGATDIAIRDNILYVNQATDLVTLSFNFDNFSIVVEDRIENVFPELEAPDGFYLNSNIDSDSVIVDWIEK